MAVRYIDRALAGALQDQREAYRVGLAALERYARQTRGAPFLQLSETEQDLAAHRRRDRHGHRRQRRLPGQLGAVLRARARPRVQGTFGDPYYGGNADFVGWDLLGYPGVRTYVSPAEQRLPSPPTPRPHVGLRRRDVQQGDVDAKPAGSDRDAD